MESNKTRNILKSVVLASCVMLSLPEMMGFTGDSIYLTNSIFSMLGWIGLIYIYNKLLINVRLDNILENILAAIFALLFSVAMAIGSDLDTSVYVEFGDWGRITSIVAFAIGVFVLIKGTWYYFKPEIISNKEKLSTKGKEENVEKYSAKQIGIIFILFIICWLPVLLASYPGFFLYDAQEELNQVLTRSFSTHHPLLHVLALGGTIALVHKITDSYNLGILAYMIIQMLIMSGCFTYLMVFLKRHHVRKWFRVATAVFICFFPVIPMYVFCSTKDSLFTAALLIMILLMYELFTAPESFFKNRIQILALAASTFVMSSLRHNGFYAFLVMIPFILIKLFFSKEFRKNGYAKKTIVTIVAALIVYVVVNKALIFVFNADSSENQEMLTVPIMQLTRIHEISPEKYTEQQKQTLYNFLPPDALERYFPKVSDFVKIDFNNAYYEEHKDEFWKLWLEMGLNNPGAYINAWMYTSYGFWYPDMLIDMYKGVQRYTFVYEDSCFFGYETELPGVRQSFIPWLDELYRRLSLEIFQQKIPVVSMLFSPGFLFWVYAYAFLCFWSNRQYDRMLTLGMVALLWMTVLIGPTHMVRYVLIFWFMLPVLLAMLFDKKSGFNDINMVLCNDDKRH